MPGYCDVGSVDRAALAGLAAALNWLEDPSRRDRLARAQQYTARLEAAARELPGTTIHALTPPSSRLPTLALTARGRTPGELAAALLEHGVIGSAGIQCAPQAHDTLQTAPAGVLRLSFGPGSTLEDAGQAIDALSAILEERADRRPASGDAGTVR
jgi:selenocysteine lyase/cysteine desulfurase